MKTPLLVIVLRKGEPSDTSAYAGILRDTFVGPQAAAGTAVPKELLQAAEFREFASPNAVPVIPKPLLESAERVLIIVLDAQADTVDADTYGKTEQALATAPGLVGARHIVVTVALKTPDSLFDPAMAQGHFVRLGLADLEERDLRLPFLALYALHNALRLFAPVPSPDGAVAAHAAGLFFSHAKRDGVPLTTAVVGWMKHLKGFDGFYDTANLDLDGDIEAQLKNAVARAILVVFRTDIFDQRYWCQKEVLWADQHGRPVITVDARWQIEHAASVVSFDNTPVVRIPDGNLVRIFTAALLEALRIELFRARTATHLASLGNAQAAVIPRYPSLVSLHEACSQLEKRGPGRRFIVYPNPSLPSLMRSAADNIARSLVTGCAVVSLDEFRLVV